MPRTEHSYLCDVCEKAWATLANISALQMIRDHYETDRRSHLSRIQELEDHVKALREAGGEAMDLISSAQSVLERYLQPDGHTKERCMDLLIGLFDGPRQRKVESAWDAASKPSNNNTGS